MKLLHALIVLCLSTSTTTALPTTCTPTGEIQHTRPSPSLEIAVATETSLLQAREQPSSIPPYQPIVTAAATQDEALASEGYYQTTYYECKTRDGKEHCGWHIPVVKMNSGAEQRIGKSWHGVVVCLGVAGWVLM